MPPTLEMTPIGTAALSLTSISTDRLSSLPSRSRRRNFERVASWPSPGCGWWASKLAWSKMPGGVLGGGGGTSRSRRSEEHTSELQSRLHLVCRLLLEKKKKYQ